MATGKKPTAFEPRTTMITGDKIPFIRTTEADTAKKESIIEYDDWEANVIIGIINAQKAYTSTSVTDGNNITIPLGAFATYHGFTVKFLLGDGTNEWIGAIDFVYDNGTATAVIQQLSNQPPSGLNIEDALTATGQFYWQITNNTGGTIYLQYRITEQIPKVI